MVKMSVSNLKDAIKKRNKDDPTMKNVAVKNLQLYLAKTDNGAWLPDNDDLDTLLQSEFDTSLYLKLRSSWRLDDSRLFGLGDSLEVGVVHVLVVVLKIESKRPAEDDRYDAVLKKMKNMESILEATLAYVAATKPKTLTDFKSLIVREGEFELDNLFNTRQSENPIVTTPILHEFWKGFGEFPPYYFVRREEVVFWKVVKKLLFVEGRVAIVGSPGVGKSCFLMLIAFYLACIKKRKVLIIRRLKVETADNALVYLDGKGSYARLSNLQSRDICAIRDQVTPKSVEGEVVEQKEVPIVLVDGFTQEQVQDLNTGYGPFKVLATSCQFDAKQDDSSKVVVLPAWRAADLLQYAKLTNWVIETGLRKIKRQDTPFAKLVKEQYFYSGGSMHEFCKKRESLKNRVVSDCSSVGNAQAFDLVYNYGGGQSKTQVDRLRRHYITDCHKEVHYHDRRWWRLSVDSGYVLRTLGLMVDTDKQLEVYKYAKSVGAGFHGVAYELLLHNAVRGAFAKRKPIVLKMREGSKYEKIEIRVPNVVCSGEDEASCYPCLSTLNENTYWYPNYPFFPFIDAVTTCEAFRSGSEDSETIVAYVQVTIRSEKKFKEQNLRRLNEEMDKNQSLKDMKRAFVVVGPDSDVCKRFILHDAPDPDTFLAMVSCFNPEQLEPEVY